MLTVRDRKLSFLIVGVVYAAAAVLGILIFRTFSAFPLWAALLIADVAATIFVFLFSLLFGNASVYDPYWSVQPPVILLSLAVGRSLSPIAVLLLLAVLFWAIRLTANWAYTFRGLTHEDWRYVMLHERTGRAYPLINFLGIHMFPTLVVYACVLPAAYAVTEAGEGNFISYLGIIVSLFAAVLQLVADIEMQSFRKQRRGDFIRCGLWRYSRHPNYLGEILMWWGVALSSLSILGGRWWGLLLGALLNTIMFLVVSIPMADRRQAKKAGYLEYRKATRSLLPLPKR